MSFPFFRKKKSKEDAFREIKTLLLEYEKVGTEQKDKMVQYQELAKVDKERANKTLMPEVERLGRLCNTHWKKIDVLIRAFLRDHMPDFKINRGLIKISERVKEIEDQMTLDSYNTRRQSMQSAPDKSEYLCSMRQMLEDPGSHKMGIDIQRMRDCLVAIV
jgi:hypothetical protein